MKKNNPIEQLKKMIKRTQDFDTTKVRAPFTNKEVKAINNFQQSGLHPFTCCSLDGCNVVNNILVAEKNGLVCPCGKYKQLWCYKAMVEFKAE